MIINKLQQEQNRKVAAELIDEEKMKTIKILVAIALLPLMAVCQKTLTLQPGPGDGKDALVHELQSERNVNYGDNPQFAAMAWTFQGDPGVIRSLIDFDLREIPEGPEIISAKLSFYAIDKQTADNGLGRHSELSGDNSWLILRITEQWEENSVKWNNKPATTNDGAIEMPGTSSPDKNYKDIDVTEMVKKKLEEPSTSHGFMIRLKNENYYRRINFASSDNENASRRPKLVIVYKCPAPEPNFSYSGDGLKVSFTNETKDADSFQWDFGDGNTSGSENPQHTYASHGEYTVKLTVRNDCGEKEISKNIRVSCTFPAPNFTVSIDALTVHFKNQSKNADSYHWAFGDGNSSTSENPSHTYSDASGYTVVLTAKNECGEALKSKVINLSCPSPDADFDYSTNGLKVTFNNRSERSKSFSWDFGDGNSSDDSSPTYTYSSPGTYTVELTAENDCGKDTHTRKIEIEAVGISETQINMAGFSIIPNPASHTAMFEFDADFGKDAHISLFSIDGKEVMHRLINQQRNVQVNLNGLPAGTYICVIMDGEEIKGKEKLVVK
ncbi:MAG: PKD domain-containing protein [Bacteroidetes bacterium]|nr:PKD domain-containing protein [Bacteroidota bacterium]HET6244056.1 PKD domain-containing protein [Bacteroidia bacterium]